MAELPMEMFKVTALENNLGWKRPLEAAWQTWRFTSLSEPPVFDHPHGENIFPTVYSEFCPCSNLCQLPLVLPLQTSKRSMVVPSLHTPIMWLQNTARSISAFSTLSKISLLRVTSNITSHLPSHPLPDSLQHMDDFLLLGSPKPGTGLLLWFHKGLIERKMHFPQPTG